MLDEAQILIPDLTRVRTLLSALSTFFQARDIAKAQEALVDIRYSPLTKEIDLVKAKLDGIYGDFLMARAEAEEIITSTVEGAEEGLQSDTEASEKELSSTPLNNFTPPKQKPRPRKSKPSINEV